MEVGHLVGECRDLSRLQLPDASPRPNAERAELVGYDSLGDRASHEPLSKVQSVRRGGRGGLSCRGLGGK